MSRSFQDIIEMLYRSVTGLFRAFLILRSEKIEPICVDTFNDARECMFKADGSLFNCRDVVNEYVYCQKDPEDFRRFLAASTATQKKPRVWDFNANRGTYDKTN